MSRPPAFRLDERLFEPSSWRGLDASNVAVPGLRAGSLAEALGWVGSGIVVTVFGRLRAGFRAVDVDLTGDRGYAVADLVADWAKRHSRWHLVRPSGGAAGRHHVFVHVDAGALAQLQEHVGRLRSEFGVGAASLDVRSAVRPLSAPHRTGVMTDPLGGAKALDAALSGCPEASPPKRPRGRRADTPRAADRDGSRPLLDASPSPVKGRRALPPEWAEYLEHGTRPTVGGGDHSQSTFELIATKQLAAAGYTPAAAWETVAGAHPEAMSKARRSQKRWVRNVWNHCVDTYTAFLAQLPDTATGDVAAEPVPEAVMAMVAAARRRLHVKLWEAPVRRRDTIAAVGHAVLDRIARTGELRVPVPERNLVLDTGFTSRGAIREALRFLDGRLGTLHRHTLDPLAVESSSFEFELDPSLGGVVLETSPPSSHTPLPPSTWTTLPRCARRLWQALQQNGPLPLPALCRSAALLPSLSEPPGTSQVRTARAVLLALATAGLAMCDAEGTWTATTTLGPTHVAESADVHHLLRSAIEDERADYRRAASGTWSAQRRRALAADHARYRVWWNGLDDVERHRRREHYAQAFDTLPLTAKEALKVQLAERRIAAGIDEPGRHAAWLAGLSPDEIPARTTELAARFAALPSPLQQATVASWNRHRNRYGLPCPLQTPHEKPAPRTVHTAASRAPDRLFELATSSPS